MTIRQHRCSDPAYPGEYLPPSGIYTRINEDWEQGPIAVNNTDEGLNYQAWYLTFADGAFTITPQTVGDPVVLDLGPTAPNPVESIQCSFSFDANGHPVLGWINSAGKGYFYYYDTVTAADWIVWNFADGVTGIGVTLDDKRQHQVRVTDIQLFYTRAPVSPDEYVLYNREQGDRFETEYTMLDPARPLIKRIGMNKQLRVQISLAYAT